MSPESRHLMSLKVDKTSWLDFFFKEITVFTRLDEDGKVLTPEELLYRVRNVFISCIFTLCQAVNS